MCYIKEVALFFDLGTLRAISEFQSINNLSPLVAQSKK